MKTKKIIFSGGGTAGPVSPLLAIFDELSNPPLFPLKTRGDAKYKFLWIGTKSGVERGMVAKENIEFRSITSGKLRRYFSWQNFIDPFKILIGFFQSIFIILKFKPDLVMSAGGFVSVPVVWSAWILRVPVLIHQQDIRPGLANKLMAPFAKVITVTFEKSLSDYGEKAIWTGNPVRPQLKIKNKKSKIKNNFNNNLPVVLVVGGGTGAGFLNDVTINSAKELSVICNMILLTGKEKEVICQISNVKCFKFLNIDEMAEALNIADIVISRSGLGLSTELSALAKPTIFIPIPDSHQEDNARFFQEKESAIVLNQKTLTPKEFVNVLSDLLRDTKAQEKLSQNISHAMKRGANEKIVEIINNI